MLFPRTSIKRSSAFVYKLDSRGLNTSAPAAIFEFATMTAHAF